MIMGLSFSPICRIMQEHHAVVERKETFHKVSARTGIRQTNIENYATTRMCTREPSAQTNLKCWTRCYILQRAASRRSEMICFATPFSPEIKLLPLSLTKNATREAPPPDKWRQRRIMVNL